MTDSVGTSSDLIGQRNCLWNLHRKQFLVQRGAIPESWARGSYVTGSTQLLLDRRIVRVAKLVVRFIVAIPTRSTSFGFGKLGLGQLDLPMNLDSWLLHQPYLNLDLPKTRDFASFIV